VREGLLALASGGRADLARPSRAVRRVPGYAACAGHPSGAAEGGYYTGSYYLVTR